MRRAYLRPAIAMIELIFAIAVMGIVMMSAPMLISTAQKSTTVALQQEGINEAASRASMIMTYPWDENDTNESCIPPVLHVTNGDSELNEYHNTGRRVGVPRESSSRTFLCSGNEYNASAIGPDGGDLDDIDDFTDTTLTSISGGSGGVDYIEQTTVSIATTIRYLNDDANYGSATVNYAPSSGTATTNIKGIDINLTSTSGVDELSKTIVLHAFSCNIGGREFEHKVLP